MEQSKKLGIEIKEDIDQQSKIKVFKNNLCALESLIDITNTSTLYDNTTDTRIYKNEYFVYLENSFYLQMLNFNKLFCDKNEMVIRYNINNHRQPEHEQFIIRPLITIELCDGVLYLTKLLDNTEML